MNTHIATALEIIENCLLLAFGSAFSLHIKLYTPELFTVFRNHLKQEITTVNIKILRKFIKSLSVRLTMIDIQRHKIRRMTAKRKRQLYQARKPNSNHTVEQLRNMNPELFMSI